MKKVIVLTTGGTIAMKFDSASGGLIPAVSGDDLIEAVPALKNIAQVEVVEFSNVPSGHVTPAMMHQLAQRVDAYAAQEDVDGITITHGTDTMEETAYMLSLACTTTKPVTITGAMRGASDMGYEGPGNILAAVRVAACAEAGGRGALLVMNDEIHAAAEVTKTHTVSCSTFASPWAGPVGHVYYDGVCFSRASENLEKLPAPKCTKEVLLLKVYAGMDDYLFKCAVAKDVDGLVVEAVGCGNVPPAVMEGLAYVRSHNIPVVLASRTFAGRVAPVYGYLGSAGSMANLGLLYAGGLSGLKARLKLMLALEMAHSEAELAQYFQEKVY